ncbi:MAG TPA: OmpW family outer membrane protein [Candidatus Acidoferrales bacterium]|nr:OmpW family outer membrane protein [Candidatus Acidoferrales bacterium]
MLGRKLIVILFVIACSGTLASAQSRYEITPFFGGKIGGRILLQNSGFFDYDKIKNSENYGVNFGYNLWDNFQAEFTWNRQPTSLLQHDTQTNTFTNVGNIDMDIYQFGILYEFRSAEAKIKPFMGAGLGWTHFTNSNSTQIGFSNKFSYNLGGGVKYFPAHHFGLRLDIRYLATRTVPQQSVQNGFLVTTSAHAKQGEATAGLIFRF